MLTFSHRNVAFESCTSNKKLKFIYFDKQPNQIDKVIEEPNQYIKKKLNKNRKMSSKTKQKITVNNFVFSVNLNGS